MRFPSSDYTSNNAQTHQSALGENGMLKHLTFVAALLSVAACGPQEKPQQDATPTKPNPKSTTASSAASPASAPALSIESASPDQALKSWWRYLDLAAAEEALDCKRSASQPTPAHLQYLEQIAHAELLAARKPKPRECIPHIFNREIDEVKTESETRAIAFATIRNSTPIPLGAEADELDKKWRTNGFKYKYLLEKSAMAWKVSQVYKYSETNKYLKKDVWERVYKVSDKPHYPSFVMTQ